MCRRIGICLIHRGFGEESCKTNICIVERKLAEQKRKAEKMKKIVGCVGLAMFLTLVSGDISAAECRHDLVEFDSDPHAAISNTSHAECADKKVFKKVFHLPAGVPLFLSAIAGLGIVALRGRTR
jgi:hypothetical protein